MMNDKLDKISKELELVFEKLQYLKVRPILVGGAVRDALICNVLSKDIDIELRREELSSQGYLDWYISVILEIAKQFKVKRLDFYIITFYYNGYEIEIAPSRREKFTQDRGHKNFVPEYTDELSDHELFKRRDLTVNAIGFCLLTKKLIDPFKGRNDIKNKKLTPCEPTQFPLDPVRLLRLIRFSLVLGFSYGKNEQYFSKFNLMNLTDYYVKKESQKSKDLLGFFKQLSEIVSLHKIALPLPLSKVLYIFKEREGEDRLDCYYRAFEVLGQKKAFNEEEFHLFQDYFGLKKRKLKKLTKLL